LQWHAKSVRPEQPSVVRTLTKQFRAQLGILASWEVATEARAKAIAANEILILIGRLGFSMRDVERAIDRLVDIVQNLVEETTVG